MSLFSWLVGGCPAISLSDHTAFSLCLLGMKGSGGGGGAAVFLSFLVVLYGMKDLSPLAKD